MLLTDSRAKKFRSFGRSDLWQKFEAAFDNCQFDSVCFASPLAQGERTEVRGFELPSTSCLEKTLTLPSPCKGEATQMPRSALPTAPVNRQLPELDLLAICTKIREVSGASAARTSE